MELVSRDGQISLGNSADSMAMTADVAHLAGVPVSCKYRERGFRR
jgi:hypothetical protein